MRSSNLTPLATLDLAGVELLGASAGPEGDLWAVGNSGKGSVVFRAHENGAVERTELAERNFHSVQPLGDDLLLVSGRSYFRNGAGEPNAVVFRDGKPGARFCLGDGIQEVQVARDNLIWTSYFDEGVFGNYGWTQPLGASGLCAWSANGERVFEYDPVAAGTDQICDAYAINVADGHAVWVYFYTSFELVRLSRLKPNGVWKGAPKGARAFAVDGKRLLIDGGYHHHDHYHLFSLTKEGLRELSVTRFEHDGQTLGGALAFGRGPHLHFLEEGRWFRVDLRSIE